MTGEYERRMLEERSLQCAADLLAELNSRAGGMVQDSHDLVIRSMNMAERVEKFQAYLEQLNGLASNNSGASDQGLHDGASADGAPDSRSDAGLGSGEAL